MMIQTLTDTALLEDRYNVFCLERPSETGKDAEKMFRRTAESISNEYLFDHKATQLLSGFTFNKSHTVLEIGSRNGTITQYLGGTFSHVVALEPDYALARKTRLSTRDHASVTVICATLKDIRFSQKFDIVFCIGSLPLVVGSFAENNAYAAAFRHLSDLLSPGGVLVVAIENQFGLKYFLGAREDHFGTRFEGIEGYRRRSDCVRTFGKAELKSLISESFIDIRFFYPYPDYKISDCVMDEEFLLSGRAGELISQIRSRDYLGPTRQLWDEMSTVLELDRNQELDFFANSFLILAGKQKLEKVSFPQHAIMFSSGRACGYSTCAQVVASDGEGLRVIKRKAVPELPDPDARLKFIETVSPWVDSLSVLTQILLRAGNPKVSLEDLIAPAVPWLKHLRSCSRQIEGRLMLDGGFLDAIWANTYPENTWCILIDQEWRWHMDLPLNVMIIRSIYDFLSRIETIPVMPKTLRMSSGRAIIEAIASSIGVKLEDRDFAEFVQIDAALSHAVTGVSERLLAMQIKWLMFHRPSRRLARMLLQAWKNLINRATAKRRSLGR